MISFPSVAMEQPAVGLFAPGIASEGGALLVLRMRPVRGASEVLGQTFIESVFKLGLQRVQSALRGKDRSLAVGVEEVAILLEPPCTDEDALKIAKRFVDLIQRAYILQGQMLYLHSWVGVAMAAMKGTEHVILLEQASRALKFAAIREPGSIVFFNAKLDQRLKTQQSLTGDLRKALPLRQLQVFYQPQVQLPTCRLVGFEALLRWRHPELGWISPADFIPLAEEIGLISRIGSWVLRTACIQATLLPESITIAVNASPLQLRDQSLIEDVQSALMAAGLNPSRLEIEVTEGLLLEKSQTVSSILERLHMLGVKLAIDDFGTGYSSLGQLARLPFDCIKIDRSMVGADSKKRAIVRAIATLGKGLGMSTLIEGIENEEELADACSDQCTLAQGFLFGRAVPPTDLPALVSRLSLP